MSKETYSGVKRDLTVSKETYSGVKRDLLWCQKRPTLVSKATFSGVKSDLLVSSISVESNILLQPNSVKRDLTVSKETY